MTEPFELWDVETANLVGTYATMGAALAVVRNAMLTHGWNAVEPLGLQRVDTRGRIRVIGIGADLVQRSEEWHTANSASSVTPVRDNA